MKTKTASHEPELHGVAVYNPSLWSERELAHYFIARQDILARIVDDLRREQPGMAGQHQLLLGLRGMGKTTLLRRIALAIRQDEELDQVWLPLSFPEEQYNISQLKDLWLNCLDALGDQLEANGCETEVEALDALIEDAAELDADGVLQILLSAADQQGKRLLLLIDNIDLIFDRIKKSHWDLRETLQAQPQLLFIGASARAVEATYQYDAAFYDFFKVHELKPLSLSETHQILTRLAETHDAQRVMEIIRHDPARINTLQTLTGGNPRTVVLLFKVLSQGLDGDVRSDLEGLLDMVTPLYKARFEALPDAAQQMIDAMALHWDPISAKILAQKLATTVNQVSALLSRLENQGIVEKVVPASGKRNAFQISERFFNIWYLMRASRRVRKKLMWLVYFLKVFFSAQELETHSRSRLSSRSPLSQRDAEYTMALAQAVPRNIGQALENRGLNHLYGSCDNPAMIDAQFDLKGDDQPLASQAERVKTLQSLKQQAKQSLSRQTDWQADDIDGLVSDILGHPRASLTQKQSIVSALAEQSQNQLTALMIQQQQLKNKWWYIIGDCSVLLYQAVAQGLMNDVEDIEGAAAAAIDFDQPLLALLPWCISIILNTNLAIQDPQSAKTACEQAIKLAPNSSWPFICVAKYHSDLESDFAAAEQQYLAAITKADNNPDAYIRLGLLYHDQLNQPDKAEQAYRKAIDSENHWARQGRLYHNQINQPDKAKQAYRKAMDIYGEYRWAWAQLGRLYQDKLNQPDKAELAYRKAIDIDSENSQTWGNLGLLYADKLHQPDKAEQAYRKAIDIDSEDSWAWSALGRLYVLEFNDGIKAEQALRKEIALTGNGWAKLGCIQAYLQQDGQAAAQSLIKAIELGQDVTYATNNLAIIQHYLLHEPKRAATTFEQAEQLDHNIEAIITTIYSLIKVNQWPIAADQIKRLLRLTADHLPQYCWPGIIKLCHTAIQKQKAAELLEIIDNSQAVQHWRPLREALAAIVSGSKTLLNGVAPEVRHPALQIMAQLNGE